MKKIILLLGIGNLFLLLTQCSVKAPEVTVTGEKTALENQVIGTYEKIEEETWLVASVRSNKAAAKREISTEQKRVLDAVQNRKFNKDEIDELKRDGSLGEDNRGFLALRSIPKLESDPGYRKRVEELITEENRDREVIMNRVIEINKEAAKSSQEEIFSIFASMHRENAGNGTWIQLASGEWVKKGQ